MNRIDMNIEYRNNNVFSHSYKETWVKTDLFCPKCGIKTVWRDASPGDFYAGPQYLCASCGTDMRLQELDERQIGESDNYQDKQRLKNIRVWLKESDMR